MRNESLEGALLVAAGPLAEACRISERTARRRIVEAGATRVGRRVFTTVNRLRRTYGEDLADAVLVVLDRQSGNAKGRR